jgi:hypothetical protein
MVFGSPTNDTTDGSVVELSAAVKASLRETLEVVKELERQRERYGATPDQWESILTCRSPRKEHYSSRWTFPILYFRDPVLKHFDGLNGLDIGARANPQQKHFRWMPNSPPWVNSENLIETYQPHYKYYSSHGSKMTAIDITPTDDPGICYGDARYLEEDNNSFDFVTMSMILGTKRCCSSPLEIGICLAELWRVLRVGGFVYIADTDLDPVVIYLASLIGFSSWASRGRCWGMPLGTILAKSREALGGSFSNSILDASSLDPLICNKYSDEMLVNCDVLWDKDKPHFTTLSRSGVQLMSYGG